MYKYTIVVMGMETYDVKASGIDEAIEKAIDCFKDDDEWYGSIEADSVAPEDCIMNFVEEC